MQMKVAWSDVNSSRIAIGTHDQRRTASGFAAKRPPGAM
jgi:hypothetical protein